MTLRTFVRDSFAGTLYHLSGHKLFSHPEEDKDYIIPEKYDTDKEVVVDWDGKEDPENPKNWPVWQKVVFVTEISVLTTITYLSAAIYSPGIEDLMRDMNISRPVAALPITLFVFGYGIGPMVLSPMSESVIFGRTFVYIASLFLVVILEIPISLVNDIASMSVLRFLSGFFASPSLTVGGASLADITLLPYLPISIAIWSVAAVCGPSLGPFFGSILIVKRNWHWAFWYVCMASGILLVVLIFFLPETLESKLLMRKAQRLRKLTGRDNITSKEEIENRHLEFHDIAVQLLWRPIEISTIEPVVVLLNLYLALVYSVIYIWFEAFPIVFQDTHHFALVPLGTSFICVIVGTVLGAMLYITYVYFTFTKSIQAGKELTPEVFLPIMIFGSLCMPAGIFIFGWTASKDLPWIAPMIGAAVFSIGSFCIFQSMFNYLAASFPRFIASVYAGNGLCRTLIAGCFPIFASSLFKNLGSEKFPVGWGSSVLGFITVAMISIPLFFYKSGPKLRARSKYSGY